PSGVLQSILWRIPVSPLMYFTYILKSEFLPAESYKRFYHGHCENLIERLKRHNSGKVRSTKAYRPWVIHYFEQYSTG
ncbi:MAG TPA: GIY-YIG nuclease family protein, partial [Ignavibacteriaceae bacterium]|nr:GIY-YIG nuclease family protein [Ignavibacteriaceae bacterium]